MEVLEKALQHQIVQGHNSLLPCHDSYDSPSDVEENKAKDSILGSVPECSPDHCHHPSHDLMSMAMSQGDSRYQSPVDNENTSTEVGRQLSFAEFIVSCIGSV